MPLDGPEETDAARRALRFAKRTVVLTYLSGLALSLSASAGVAAKRVSAHDVLIAIVGLLFVYRPTGQLWHVGRTPHLFQASIQKSVAARVIATTTAPIADRRFSVG